MAPIYNGLELGGWRGRARCRMEKLFDGWQDSLNARHQLRVEGYAHAVRARCVSGCLHSIGCHAPDVQQVLLEGPAARNEQVTDGLDRGRDCRDRGCDLWLSASQDRKSTRLNSSH